MNTTMALVQIIAILGTALTIVAKLSLEAWKKRNGNGGKSSGFLSQNQRDRYLSDLEQHHRPVTDPESGQPHFPWYDNTRSILPEIKRLTDSIEELNKTLKTCQERCVLAQLQEDR